MIHKITGDIVPVFQLECWPEEIEDQWRCREKVWPDDVTKCLIVSKGCFIVARDSRDQKRQTRWQVSFVNAEIELFKLWSEEQKIVYFLAKSVYYKNVIPLNPTNDSKEVKSIESQFSSYLLKTAMLFLCEEHPPEDHFWSNINEAASHLLQTLVICFEQESLQNYFFTNVNLLENISSVRLQEAISVLQTVMYNPIDALAVVMKELVKRIETLNKYAQGIAFVSNQLFKNHSYDRQTLINAGKFLVYFLSPA